MSFALDLKNFAAKTDLKQGALVRKIVLEVGRVVVERSPVGDRERWAANIERAASNLPPLPEGYVGGRFRANWQYGFNRIPSGEVDKVDATGAVSLDAISNGVLGSSGNGTGKHFSGIHYIANNLPYAQRLEEGWSGQAPSGVVAITVVQFQSLVNKATSS